MALSLNGTNRSPYPKWCMLPQDFLGLGTGRCDQCSCAGALVVSWRPRARQLRGRLASFVFVPGRNRPTRATDSQFDASISSSDAPRSCYQFFSVTSMGDGTTGAGGQSLLLLFSIGDQLNMTGLISSRMRHRSVVLARLGHIHLGHFAPGESGQWVSS